MKNIYLLLAMATRPHQMQRRVKTKLGIISLFFAGMINMPAAYAQNNCDTLVAKDGRRIAVEVIRSSSKGLLYTKCSETTGQQYFMSQEKILELRKAGAVAPVKTATPPPALPSVEKEVRFKEETDLSKPKTIVWAGLTLGSASIDFEANGRGYFQFGAEIGFKDSPLRLGVLLHPIFSRNDGYESYEQKGARGEIGLVLKSFTKGRLTGNVSKAYWGIDLRTGRQAYTYSGNNFPTQLDTDVKYTWTTVMPRIGFQFHYKMLAFDLALPIGYQFYRYYNTSGNVNTEYTGGNIALQPSFSLGLRF
ncbi:MAG: hypothetical protein H7246_06255 [Phycisphaerae bacterium]|nr:hypothetical protein [Saprospiraceae bacterium]